MSRSKQRSKCNRGKRHCWVCTKLRPTLRPDAVEIERADWLGRWADSWLQIDLAEESGFEAMG